MTDDNERLRQRYADDPEYRRRRLDSNKAYRKRNKAKLNAKAKLRYATDTGFRERTLAERKAHRKRHKAEINAKQRLRWATDAGFRDNVNERNRAFRLKSCYGITVADYNALFAGQKGRCAICNKTSRRRLCVDHCHRTKLVRRLLCPKCNSALGFLDDDPRLVRKALACLSSILTPKAGGTSNPSRALKPKPRPPTKPARKKRR